MDRLTVVFRSLISVPVSDVRNTRTMLLHYSYYATMLLQYSSYTINIVYTHRPVFASPTAGRRGRGAGEFPIVSYLIRDPEPDVYLDAYHE